MNSSKIVLVFCAFAAFSVLAEGIDDKIRTTIKRCEDELGVDALAPPENLKCLRACIMKGIGLMKEDGTIRKDNFSIIVPNDLSDRDVIISNLQSCTEKAKGTDACELATSFHDCVDKNLLARLQNMI